MTPLLRMGRNQNVVKGFLNVYPMDIANALGFNTWATKEYRQFVAIEGAPVVIARVVIYTEMDPR